MNPEETKNSAEQWLDEALAHYSAAEPRVELETRSLAKLHAHAAQGQRRWMYTFAGAAAVVVFAVVMVNMRSAQPDIRKNAAPRVATPEQAANRSAANVVTRAGKPDIRLVHERHAIAHKNVTGSRMVLAADGVKQ